jgi:hypothetical protein
MAIAEGRNETTGEELKEGFGNEEVFRFPLDMDVASRDRNDRLGQQPNAAARTFRRRQRHRRY